MRLLLDAMYSPAVAAQLRARGRDATAAEPGAGDAEVWAAAVAEDRVLVTENVLDFRALEAAALARGEPAARLYFTTAARRSRGDARAVDRLVLALLLAPRPVDAAPARVL